MCCQCFELVRRGDEGQASDVRDFCSDLFSKANASVQTSAHSGAALCQFVDVWQAHLNAFDALGNLMRVATKFLTEGQRGRILSVGTANFDDVFELFRLRSQSSVEFAQTREQYVTCVHTDCDVHCGREGVVRRLTHVAVVVRVNGRFRCQLTAEDFNSAVRDHFVRVHVRLCARASLPNNEREVVVEFSFDDFGRGLLDRFGQGCVQIAKAFVDDCRSFFDHAECTDHRHGLTFPTNWEVHDRTLGLCAPVFVCGDFKRAEAVGFGAGCGHLDSPCYDLGLVIPHAHGKSMQYTDAYRVVIAIKENELPQLTCGIGPD